MGLISKVGRRRFRVRATLATMVAILLVGSVTMLYPLSLMLAGSTKSSVDTNEKTPIPTFLFDRNMLWRKHVEGKFNESVLLMQSVYQVETPSFEFETYPQSANPKLVDAWDLFLADAGLPSSYYTIGYLHTPLTAGVLAKNFRNLRNELQTQYGGDIQRLNFDLATEFYDWNSFTVSPPQYLRRGQAYDTAPISVLTRNFIEKQPASERVYFSIEGFYRMQYLRSQYPTIAQYNAHHQTHYTGFNEIVLARTINDPALQTPAERDTWEAFVRVSLNLLWVHATPDAEPGYRDYLKAKYQDLAAVNSSHNERYSGFEQVRLPVVPGEVGASVSDWEDYLRGWRDLRTGQQYQLPSQFIRVDCVDFQFQDFLRKRFASISDCNQAMDTQYTDFSQIAPPQRDAERLQFDRQASGIRWEFLTRNYVSVSDYLLRHGRAAWNTFVYCALAVIGSLTINPLAAYALSRYRPPSTTSILLLLMLTMAFPPMVTQIPVFLMMRDMGLLNTLWALILPGIANGYSIFLLKGFFDSLPKELYESASLDGAGEIRIFWQITMSLSKPVLAVIALSAFTAAYANFMFALLLCQDRNAWTLMVWIYQLQVRASEGVVLAALTLAAIPSLLVFILCQRLIIRGIVIPVEK